MGIFRPQWPYFDTFGWQTDTNSQSAQQITPGGTKTTKMAYEVIKGHWPLMTSDDLGKVTVSVRTTDITSQHLSMSISPANIPKFTSFKRWNGTERKFRLTWPRKSGHRSNVIVGTDLKFSGKVWNCSTVRYTYQVSWRSADPFASYSWKTRGGCINPPVPARVKVGQSL